MNIHFKNLSWVYLAALLSLPFGYFVRVLYAQNLSLADYGLFYGLFSFFGFFAFLRNWGIGGATNYYTNQHLVKKEYSQVKTLFYFNQLVQLGLSIIIGLILFLVNDWVFATFYAGEEHIEIMLNMFILYWVVSTVYDTNSGFLGIWENQKISSLLSLSSIIFIFICSSIGFYFLDNFIVPPLIYFLSTLSISVYSAAYLLVKYKKVLVLPRFYWHKSFFGKILKYSNKLVVAGLVSSVFVMTDTMVIQYFKGAEQVALYATAIATASLLTLFVFPALGVLSPLIAKLWHRTEKDKISEIISSILNHFLALLLPFAICFIVYAKPFILTLFGEKFAGSIIILQIFVGAILLKNVIVILSTITTSIGKPKETSTNTLISGVVNVTGNLLVIQFFGVLGVVCMTVFSYILILCLQVRLILTEIKLNFNILFNIKIIGANLVFLILVYSLKDVLYIEYTGVGVLNLLFNGGIVFLLAVSVYIVLLIYLDVINRTKIDSLRKLIFPQSKV